MTATDEMPRSSDEVRCSYHRDVMTRLRCSRCGKPICPRCGVRTPVGLRCPECAGVRGLPTYRTESSTLARSLGAGLAVAVVVGLIWGRFPAWNFYLSLVLGFGVAETMARLSANKRGQDLQIAAMAAVGAGLVLSRVILAQRYGIGMSDISNNSVVIADGFRMLARDAMYLRPIPDGLFAGLALLIAWYRFR